LTRGGKRRFLIFIDDATHFSYVYMLKTKDEALNYFKIYKAKVENQLGKKFSPLRDDCGGEYASNDFSSFYSEHGIIHEFTPTYSPLSLGSLREKNKTPTDLVNGTLESVNMSKVWWGEAIFTANFIINKIITKRCENAPYEGWRGRRPNVSFL
jgi:hypothetical protein